jgi:hypothetical protein
VHSSGAALFHPPAAVLQPTPAPPPSPCPSPPSTLTLHPPHLHLPTPPPTPPTPHHPSYFAICAVIRNQRGPDLREWVEYHAYIGARKIYVYDNNSTVPGGCGRVEMYI